MNKWLLLVLSISSLSVYAQIHTSDLQKEKNKIANIYADQLISIFDEELTKRTVLSENMSSILLSDTYAQLLASREYIEHHGGEAIEYGQKSLLEVTDLKLYFEVINEIIHDSVSIKLHQNLVKSKEQELSLFPSATKAGNVTGNTFPVNVWSLTFDDGPHKTRTQDVLDDLYLHNMKATFFVLMRQANKYPSAIDSIIKNDMELALHSYNHLNLSKANSETILYEVAQSKKELAEVTDKNITLFRLPYGAGMRMSELRQTIADQKLIHIFWNVDTLDWKDKDPKSILERTKLQMELTPNKSGIILFHDIHQQSVLASEMVMNYLNTSEKKVCVVGEVIDFINGIEQTCL